MSLIGSEYFSYEPLARHLDGCPRAESNVWEVTSRREETLAGEFRRLAIRLVCEACRQVLLLEFDHQPASETHTDTSGIGYGSKPEKVLGVYLWPGPPLWAGDEHGAMAYYVTTGPKRPRVPGDCLGVVGWQMGTRGGIKWAAGLHPTEYGVKIGGPKDCRSRRAAVAWVIQQQQIENGR